MGSLSGDAFVNKGLDNIFAMEIRLAMRFMRLEDIRGRKWQLLSYPLLNDGWICDGIRTKVSEHYLQATGSPSTHPRGYHRVHVQTIGGNM